jgi:sugar (pentulose or hexulose) kinase
MSKRVLAFDFGASSGRAMVGELSEGRLSVTEIHRFQNDPVHLLGTMYWDYLRLWLEIKEGIRRALAGGKVDAIGIDTWGVDFGLIDERGELIANPVHYRDGRTLGIPEELAEQLSPSALYAATGTQSMRINTVYQLAYLAKHRPEQLARAKTLLFIPDLMAYSLTGKMRTEATVASTSGFFDPHAREVSRELLSQLGLPDLTAPSIRPGEVYGYLSEELCREFECEPIPVIAVCTHDTASAVAAAPAEGEFAYISCGTWSLFGTELPEPHITPESEAVQYTNEAGWGGSVRFLRNIMGLWLIQESRRQWLREGENVSFSDLEREAIAATPFRSFIDCDAPEFEMAGDLPNRVRDFCRATGQPVPETRGEVMRTIYESLAMKYRENLGKLQTLTEKRYPALHMLGGGIKDTLLCRMSADAMGIPVIAGPAEATAMGNIAVQMIALGEIADLPAARKIIADSVALTVYRPEHTADWEDAVPRYRQILGKSALTTK